MIYNMMTGRIALSLFSNTISMTGHSEKLIHLASYYEVPTANMAQAVLAANGIRSALGNVEMVAWFWHYSWATGGVTISVLEPDVDDALDVLSQLDKRAVEECRCSKCDEARPLDWDACWNCESQFQTEDESTIRSWGEEGFSAVLWLLGFGAVISAMMVVCGMGQFTPIFLLFVYTFALFNGNDNEAPTVEKTLAMTEASLPGDRMADALEQAILRAWQASVIGILFLPPTAFCSMAIVIRVGKSLHRAKIGRAATLRYALCWLLNPLLIAGTLFFAMAVVYVIGRDMKVLTDHVLDSLFRIWQDAGGRLPKRW
jgi:hypothetical protein